MGTQYQGLLWHQQCQAHTLTLFLWLGIPWIFLVHPHSSHLLLAFPPFNSTSIVRLTPFLTPPHYYTRLSANFLFVYIHICSCHKIFCTTLSYNLLVHIH